MKAAKMPIKITTAEVTELETLLGQHRYYIELLASAPLLTADSLTAFVTPVSVVSENDDDEDDDHVEFEDDEDDGEGHVVLPDLDDEERKQLDTVFRSVLRRRIAKVNIELTKFGVQIADAE